MKKYVYAVLILLMGASLAQSVQKPVEWSKFTSLEGGYSVLLPAQPEIGSQKVDTAVGQTQYLATLLDGNSYYLIGYFDYAPGTTFSLDKARDGMVAAIKGTLISETMISLGGKPGRELKVFGKTSQGTEFLICARTYDIGNRVYVLQFIIPQREDGSTNDEKMARFFNSFQLTTKQ